MEIITKLIREEDYITTEWSGGKTTQLFIYPEDSNYKELNFKFRLSSATVELETSEFTILEEVYRYITPLDNKLKLTHNHKEYISLNPFEIYDFDGGINTTSYGKVRDFNLMLCNGAKGELDSIYINGEYTLLMQECSNETREAFYFIYAYNDKVNINIDNDVIIVRPMQILLIKPGKNKINEIKIKSENPTRILVAKIYIYNI